MSLHSGVITLGHKTDTLYIDGPRCCIGYIGGGRRKGRHDTSCYSFKILKRLPDFASADCNTFLNYFRMKVSILYLKIDVEYDGVI